MNEFREVSIRGKVTRVPVVRVQGLPVVVTGSFLRVASVHDAAFVDSNTTLDPVELRRELAAHGMTADLVTFAQRIDEPKPAHPYPYEMDNAAVARSTSYDEWWGSLPQEARKNVRRSAKRGVTVEVTPFGDALVRGIKELYDETPLRQGRRFWHYGKDVETIRRENSSYLDRSEFIGAFHEGRLIGFTKFVYVGKFAVIMQILALASEQDKRPMNALIAKAMEVCHAKGVDYLVYSKYTYGSKKNDDMVEFKRRNGFVQMDYPRYTVPLTLRGRFAMLTGAHRGLLGMLPAGAIERLSKIRAAVLRRRTAAKVPAQPPVEDGA